MHENLDLIPSTHVKQLSVEEDKRNSSTGEAEKVGFLGFASQAV